MGGNFFDISTREDNKLLNILSFDHLNRLKAYSNYSDVKNLYKQVYSVYLDFIYSYSDWIASEYSLKFETKKLIGYLEDISLCRIHEWNIKLLKVLPENSNEYKLLFPEGLTPFIIGDTEDKLKNIKTLAEKVNIYSQAIVIKKDINIYYKKIVNAKNIIETKITESASKYDNLEKSRVELSKFLFKNYNLLLEIFANNPRTIQKFFDFNIFPENVKLSFADIFSKINDDSNGKNFKIEFN